MRVALLTTLAADKKEPLVEMMNRVRQAFLDAGMGEASIRFNFGDPLVPGLVSSVDRVLKRYPDLKRFVTEAEPLPGVRGARRISNGPLSPAAGEGLPYETLQAIAAGVPRSFPFHSVVLHFIAQEFGALGPVAPRSADLLPGILLSDSWWVNGRVRRLSACTVVEAEPSAKKLPPMRPPVAAVLAACGKVKRTVQTPVPDEDAAAQAIPVAPPLGTSGASANPAAAQAIPVALPLGALMVSANPAAAQAVKPVVADYRARIKEIVERAALPHDLPPPGPALQASGGLTAGPRKPALERVFKPMGYSCQGGSGTFTLRRRTAANLTVELYLDVGTWSHLVLPIFRVLGVGFKASLMLPVAAQAAAGAQYPIGNAEQWEKIVENLGALVKELDRSFVPDIERVAGPSPEWYRPES
jgi:hypothetical protein